jgi:hypothetical protein
MTFLACNAEEPEKMIKQPVDVQARSIKVSD